MVIDIPTPFRYNHREGGKLMNRTIIDLYLGNIYPAEKEYPKTSEYGKLNLEQAELYERIEKALPKDEKKLIEDFSQYALELSSIHAKNMFTEGFRIGMRLAAEAFTDDKK